MSAGEQGLQLLRLPRRDDQPVDVLLQALFQGFPLAFAEPGIGMVEDPHHGALEGSRRVLNPVADQVPERRDLPGKGDRDAQLFPRGEIAGGQVGPIAQGLGGAQDLGPGRGVDSRPVVERPVHGADGDAERIRDLADSRRVRPFPAPGTFRVSHDVTRRGEGASRGAAARPDRQRGHASRWCTRGAAVDVCPGVATSLIMRNRWPSPDTSYPRRSLPRVVNPA